MLTQSQQARLTSALDQSKMEIAELLDCEEYRKILLFAIGDLTAKYQEAMDHPEVTAETITNLKCNIIDLMNILRMAQAYLCQHVLDLEAKDSPDDSEPLS